MKVTEELRAAIACLTRRDSTFMATCVSGRQIKTALGFFPIGHELPEGIARDLRRYLENATRVAKLENGQVYFCWGLIPTGVDLVEEGDDFTNIQNTTFTLESLFQ